MEPQLNAFEQNEKIYKKELFVVTASVLLVIFVGLGVLFMLPFPGLLEVYVWGYPFPFWYQMTIAYVGVIAYVYWIVVVLGKIDAEKAKAKAETEQEVA